MFAGLHSFLTGKKYENGSFDHRSNSLMDNQAVGFFFTICENVCTENEYLLSHCISVKCKMMFMWHQSKFNDEHYFHEKSLTMHQSKEFQGFQMAWVTNV